MIGLTEQFFLVTIGQLEVNKLTAVIQEHFS